MTFSCMQLVALLSLKRYTVGKSRKFECYQGVTWYYDVCISCSFVMMDFESFAKLWPHQLDLLSGPLLEGDDDGDDVDNPISNELISTQNAHILSESSTNSDFHDSLEVDELRDEVHKTCAPSKSSVRTFCVSTKNSCSSAKKTGLGMLVYVGRKHGTRTDSDEEVDVETVDEELNRSPMRKSALSYRAFSRQMLSVVEDKEILHEVPNVIFANDGERETGLGSESATNCERKCSAMTQALGVLQEKEVLREVPNVMFSNDTEKVTLGCKKSCDGTTNTETKCSTAVLQASDVDSLLEQFEASEGITSQELKTSVLEDNKISVDEKAVHSVPSEKKDVSPYIIQKIKMSSVVKKGPILIPPSHQPKSKARISSQSSLESRKSCHSSSSSFPVNKECASKTTLTSKYSFTLDHDHDYCTNSVSKIVAEKDEDVILSENKKRYEDVNFESGCVLSDKSLSCESIDSVVNCCANKSGEEYFIPDAEFEVEIAGSQVDGGEETSVKVSLAMQNLHDTSHIEKNTPKTSCGLKSDKYISNNINFPTNSDQLAPVVVPSEKLLKPSSLKTGFHARTVNNFNKLETSGSVLLNDKITETSLGKSVKQSSSLNCNSSDAKRKQDNSLTDSPSLSPNKKCCSRVVPSTQNPSQRPLFVEKIDDALWRTRSPCVDSNGRPFWKSEKQKQIEERRVVYVGKLPEGLKVNDLRECFTRFGPIQDISIHFRESGDNYGFVTFFNRSDAYEVVERGKLDPKLRRFDLCFGGRRQFCRTRYSDLDSVDDGPFRRSLGETDFDTLLQKAKAGSQYVKQSSTAS